MTGRPKIGERVTYREGTLWAGISGTVVERDGPFVRVALEASLSQLRVASYVDPVELLDWDYDSATWLDFTEPKRLQPEPSP